MEDLQRTGEKTGNTDFLYPVRDISKRYFKNESEVKTFLDKIWEDSSQAGLLFDPWSGELKSHMLHDAAKRKKYCSEDF